MTRRTFFGVLVGAVGVWKGGVPAARFEPEFQSVPITYAPTVFDEPRFLATMRRIREHMNSAAFGWRPYAVHASPAFVSDYLGWLPEGARWVDHDGNPMFKGVPLIAKAEGRDYDAFMIEERWRARSLEG